MFNLACCHVMLFVRSVKYCYILKIQKVNKILGKKFFERPTIVVARDLLGKYLVRQIRKNITKYLIMEVEAYDGFKDKASHASRGMTKRNAPMFGEAGRWYVYFTYGMHHMLNIVTGPKNYPAAILIRGAGGINGPGRITKQLKIDKIFNDKIASPKTGLWIENNKLKPRRSAKAEVGAPTEASELKIENFPRVGVNYAGPIWSKKKWRFLLTKTL